MERLELELSLAVLVPIQHESRYQSRFDGQNNTPLLRRFQQGVSKDAGGTFPQPTNHMPNNPLQVEQLESEAVFVSERVDFVASLYEGK
jgi:hypothetical protein